MAYKRVLSIQDISCLGQCSLTVALPILSACGHETCVLPTMLLSTHTTGFEGYTLHDLSPELPKIHRHWHSMAVKFDAIYTGYLGKAELVDAVLALARDCAAPQAALIVDPAMADHGVLYPGFDSYYVDAMRRLCCEADYLLPNITEACFLTGLSYQKKQDPVYIEKLSRALLSMGAKNVILTGAEPEPGAYGVMVCSPGNSQFYQHEKVPESFHGTGDVFASAFTGVLLQGSSCFSAAKIAADYTLRCIRLTREDPSHWYGMKFEPLLSTLIADIEK